MGTSQSSKGPGGGSPLVPPWADDQPQQPLPSPQERRFAPFRESLGNAVSNGNRADFRKAIGHYARKASGGSSNAARRLGSVTQAGAELFGALVGMPSAPGEPSIDLGSLAGLPCEIAISTIAQALTSQDGDSEKICAAMNHALVEALDGVEIFDLKWSTKTGHRVRVFSSIDFPIRLVVTHHYIRAVLVRCNIQRYSPLLRELHR